MSKRTRRVKNLKRKNKSKKSKKTRLRGGNEDKVKCCICQMHVNKNSAFIPRQCLMKYGEKAAHRICANCWWDESTGFARENASHNCPGCLNNMPLNQYKKEASIVIDLTED